MQLLGADSDLRPQTELRAVCKGGRRIRVDACGIYRGYEFPAGLVEPEENFKEAGIREMKEETGLTFTPIEVDPAYEKPAFTTIGLTDESCAIVFGMAEGRISREFQEDTEEIEVVLADREEVRRILKEENIAIMCSYMLMHFLHDEPPFDFLNEL